MLLWIVPVILLVLVLSKLGFSRLNIQRDRSREGKDDQESILAYDRVSRWLLFALIRYFVINQLKKDPPEGTLLDAGCGPGYLALTIARKYPLLEIIGIDLSKEMIELAKINQTSAKINSRVRFQEADIQELPFEPSYLDLAVSTLSLHHWSDPKQAFLEIHRVLKPHGQFLIFDLRRDMPRITYYALNLGQRFLVPTPIRRINGALGSIWSSFTPYEMEKLLSSSPFSAWRVKRGWGWAYMWGQK